MSGKKIPEICVIPVGGKSTRNLPATKALHKGLLTLGGKPVIQYAIEQAKSIGIKEVVFVYGDELTKDLFTKHFTKDEALEKKLESDGKLDLLEIVRDIAAEGMSFHYVKQEQAQGLGHAILQAKDIVKDRDFIVLLPDDIFISKTNTTVLAQLAETYKKNGGSVQAIGEFNDEEIRRYASLINPIKEGRAVKASGLLEKPKGDIPSHYGALGMYILDNQVMQELPNVKKGAGGEIQLTDAIDAATRKGMVYSGHLYEGVRLDCGTREELAKANIYINIMSSSEMAQYAKEVLAEKDSEEKNVNG